MSGPATVQEREVLGRRMPELLGCLVSERVEVSVVLWSDAADLAGMIGHTAPVHVLPLALPPSSTALARLPRAVAMLRSLLHEIDVDLVEGDEPMPAIALGLANRGRTRRPMVYRRHHGAGHGALLLASRAAARLADATIVSTEAMRIRAARDDRTEVERVLVAQSGMIDLRAVSPDEVLALRARLEVLPGDSVVLVLARFRAEKGIDVLLEAIDDVKTSNGRVHVVAAGTGPDGAALRASAARRRTPVHFVGHQSDVAPWLALADVVAMPSRRESFGRTTVEAMAAGRPLVASAVGGLVEAIEDGVTGRLVPPGDPRALAAAISGVLSDAPKARAMGLAARHRYETRYTIAHMASSWRRAWEQAQSLSRTGGAS